MVSPFAAMSSPRSDTHPGEPECGCVIRDFHVVRRDLVFAVDPSLYPEIEGSTDSELHA
jgi:hypothetical protein